MYMLEVSEMVSVHVCILVLLQVTTHGDCVSDLINVYRADIQI